MRSTASSRLSPPPPPPPCGRVSSTRRTAACTLSVRKVRSALACMPNSSGLSCAGRSSTTCGPRRPALAWAACPTLTLPSGTCACLEVCMPGRLRGCMLAAGRACLGSTGCAACTYKYVVAGGGSRQRFVRMRRAPTFRNTSISVPVGTEYAAPPSLCSSYPAASAACRARPALSPQEAAQAAAIVQERCGNEQHVGIPLANQARGRAGAARRGQAPTWWK